MPMKYPERIIKLGETDPRIVKALKTQLNRALAITRNAELKLDVNDPNFGPKMKAGRPALPGEKCRQ